MCTYTASIYTAYMYTCTLLDLIYTLRTRILFFHIFDVYNRRNNVWKKVMRCPFNIENFQLRY